MCATPAEPLYLCLDQGGHASRALVFDRRGNLQASSLKEVSVHSPRADFIEQDPEALIDSIGHAMTQAADALGARAGGLVKAGIATQRSSIVCWDRQTGHALSPVISWQDRRAHDWLARFSAHADEIHNRTGLMLSAHYGASKLRWCLDHLPAVARALREGRLVMGPLASFVLFRMLEEKPLWVDPANASRTLLWNLGTMDWDPWLLELFAIPAQTLPRSVPTQHTFGHVRLKNFRLPLCIATGDQSAALFAPGPPRPDTAYVNIGTGAFVQRPFTQPVEAPGLLRSLVYRDADRVDYVLEGTVNGAGAALAWAEKQWSLDSIVEHLPDWLLREGEIPVFLNGVSGLGAPYWVADFASRLVGGGEPWQKAVAVSESIVFLLKRNIEILQNHPPALTRLHVTGGLSRSDELCQRLADLTQLLLVRPGEHEATARGTAHLLAGFPDDWPQASRGREFRPKRNIAFAERYAHWRAEMDKAIKNP